MRKESVLGYTALYTLSRSQGDLFKRWKKSGRAHRITTLLLDVYLKNAEGKLAFQECSHLKKVLIPVPHDYQRQWVLGGSTSERFSQQISAKLNIPVLRVLRKPSIPSLERRQAEKGAQERRASPPRMEVLNSLENPQKTLGILVDDLRTTGSTVTAAVELLKKKRMEKSLGPESSDQATILLLDFSGLK